MGSQVTLASLLPTLTIREALIQLGPQVSGSFSQEQFSTRVTGLQETYSQPFLSERPGSRKPQQFRCSLWEEDTGR